MTGPTGLTACGLLYWRAPGCRGCRSGAARACPKRPADTAVACNGGSLRCRGQRMAVGGDWLIQKRAVGARARSMR